MKKITLANNIPPRPTFRSCNIEAPSMVLHYKRNLPHLRIPGATYFVTFRLADSIPKNIAARWEQKRYQWLKSHGIDPKIIPIDSEHWKEAYLAIPFIERLAFEREQQRQFFIELDKCHGSCLLEKTHVKVSKALEFFHGKRIWIGDYVVMPNHVHVLVQPFIDVKLEEWLYSVKRFSSTEIGKEISLKTMKCDKGTCGKRNRTIVSYVMSPS